MLARGAGARAAVEEVAYEGPEAEHLLLPAARLTAASPSELVGLVRNVQEARIELSWTFTSRYQDLVTAGRAEEYPMLVDRFSQKFAACQSSLEMISKALASHPFVSSLVSKVATEESKRLEIQLDLQVLEQRLSLLGLDDPDHADLKQKVALKRGALKTCGEHIFETLEELQCEAADLAE